MQKQKIYAIKKRAMPIFYEKSSACTGVTVEVKRFCVSVGLQQERGMCPPLSNVIVDGVAQQMKGGRGVELGGNGF